MVDEGAIATAKSALRRALRQARARDFAACPYAGAQLAAQFPASLCPAPGEVVASYRPIGTEIDPRPLEAALRAKGVLVALPRIEVVQDRLHLEFREWDGDDALVPGPFGTVEPPASAALMRPVVVLVPLLGFDRRGRRLGYGKGCYDAGLSALRQGGDEGARAPFVLGLAFAGQEVAEIPADAHDERLDGVLIPAGFLRCGE